MDADVRTPLAELLLLVEQGQVVTITRHGRPVARLVPAIPPGDTVQQLLEFRQRYRLGGRTLRSLIEEGRRY